MINNKIITITENNQFDKGWMLFSPTSLSVDKNWKYKKIDTSSIVKLITFSTSVNLILSEACLPSRILDELEWVKKYIKINIIAKSKSIIEKYKNLGFKTTKIDPSISLNYIGVRGKENGFFIFDNDFCEVDESIEKIYFDANEVDKYAFMKEVKKIFVFNNGKHKEFNNIIALAKEYGTDCAYYLSYKEFNRDSFEYAKNNKAELFISDFIIDAILVMNKDDSICKIDLLNNGCVVLTPIEKITRYIGSIYKNLFFKDSLEVKMIPSNVFICSKGHLEKLNIQDKITIENTIEIKEMNDFIEESFDSSITDKHNDFSEKAKQVEYRFILVPPLFDKTYKESTIYNEIKLHYQEWSKCHSKTIDLINKSDDEFMSQGTNFRTLVKQCNDAKTRVGEMINKCLYTGFYSELDRVIKSFTFLKNNLFEDCKEIFNALNKESSNNKFDKFDVEIEGYKKTIAEKEALVFVGEDVLSNKRRIEILNKKIKDLEELKARFESSETSRSSKVQDEFIAFCRKAIDGVSSSSDSDSITKIVSNKEESKMVKLNSFILKNLKNINDYLSFAINALKEMYKIQIPEDYPVFEKDNKRYIVINDLKEFKETQNIQSSFDLKCLARRNDK